MAGSKARAAEASRQWVGRHPLFAAALWIVLAHIASGLMPWTVCLILLLALVLGLWIGKPWIAVAWLSCMLLAEGVGLWRDTQAQARAEALSQAATSTYSGKLLAEPRGDESFWQAPVRLTSGSTGIGAKVWWQGRGSLPVEGSVVRASGRFERPEPPRQPGEFDRRDWLEDQGIRLVFRQQDQFRTEVQTPAWSSRLAALREHVRTAISRGLEEDSTAAKVIRAVVLGEKPHDDEALLEDFRYSGSMHVFSVSGLHVGMVAVLVWLIAAFSGIGRRWLALPVVGLVFAYAWLTGANPPAVRAAWMAAVFLAAFCFRRRPDLPNALGAILLVLLIWDVRQLNQVSVQLSYGVVTAIAFGLPRTTRWFAFIGAAPMYMPAAEIKGVRLLGWRLRQWMASTLAVSCAASLGAAPMTLWHYGLVTPISVVAALLLLPLVFLIMALAMVSILLSPLEVALGPIMTVNNRANGLLAGACAKVAHGLAEVPGGHWHRGREDGPLLMIFDLKHGDGAAFWLPQEGSSAVLIDCGGRYSFVHPVASCLKQLGIEVDSIVLTHPDGGHVGGGHPVWSEWPIQQVLLPVEQARSSAYRGWLQEAPAHGVKLLQAAKLRGLPMGDEARIEWLNLPDAHNQNFAADHRALVLRLHWQGWKILWHSDAGGAAERAMLESGRDLSADVIVAGKHRADLSLSDAFVEAVDPQVIMIGNDEHPQEERFDPQKIRRWSQSGIAVLDQSKCGAVLVRPLDGGLEIEGYVNGQKLRLK